VGNWSEGVENKQERGAWAEVGRGVRQGVMREKWEGEKGKRTSLWLYISWKSSYGSGKAWLTITCESYILLFPFQ